MNLRPSRRFSKLPTNNANQIMQPSHNLSRRDFIRSSANLALSAGILSGAELCHAAQKPTRWPVACRDGHLKATGKPDSWSALKELGAVGVEVAVNEALMCTGLYHPEKKYSVATTDELRALKADLEANGLILTALCMNNRLDERLERELAWAKQLVAAAQKLDVRAIRIDVVPRAIKAEEFLPFAIKACKQLCELAEGTTVRYGIENHGDWTNKPEVLENLFNAVGSSHLGLTLDAMNFYWFGHPLNDLYGICEKFASRTVHTHCKNLRYPDDKKNAPRPIGWEYEQHAAPLYDGDIDYQRVAAILRQANYGGDLCLENECLGRFPKDQHAEILKKEVALLRKLAAA
jgi:sugar phosphate isomerase/epimerase